MTPPGRLDAVAAMDRAISAQSDSTWEKTVVTAYEQHARILWEYARRLGHDHDGAEDTVQEAFARLLHLAVARRPTNIGGWLYRTIHNLVIDEHRRGRRIATGSVEALGDRRSVDDPDVAERIAMWDAVDRLPARQREVIFLRYRAGLEFAAIGSIMGIGESGARANAFRAMQSLKKSAESWT
jgi:RNA polymerase sigma-70 factor, ECF subfamily